MPESVAVRNEPGIEPGRVVEADYRGERRVLEHAVGDHRGRPGQRLLGRLEDQLDAAAERAADGRERVRHTQRDGRVHVVAAGVHLSGHERRERDTARLLDGQRIHVRAHAHGRPGSAADHADDAGPADARPERDVQFRKVGGDSARRLVLLERELRMLVYLPASAISRLYALDDGVDFGVVIIFVT